ncbi:unnamed protein product [Brachionus calyciflorus]|uniref:Ras-related protein Rab-1 n=1 Tax=Brachionus calyciflorus TaxID=104777 RepID=A0A813M5N7_9BILA|nr:unnamed protein product [Brachionus calyciflorus]
MSKKSYDHLFKIILIGDSSVGKSSIIFRYVDDLFHDSYVSTIGVDFKTKTINVNDNLLKLQIWDTAGQERFHSITYSYYRSAQAIVLVYDVTNANSFENISKWLRNVDEYAGEEKLKIIVGNKCDAEDLRAIPFEHGEKLAKKNNIEFIETSAKSNVNIDKLFRNLSKVLLEKGTKLTPDGNNSFKNYTGEADYSIKSLMSYTQSSVNSLKSGCC